MGQFLPSLLIFACSGLLLLGILWGTRRYRWTRSHWVSFAFLLPFVMMLWVHHALHLSNALMVATPPGEHEAHTFNLVMVVVFYAGIAVFVTHTLILADRNWRWLAAKSAVLVGYWGSMMCFAD